MEITNVRNVPKPCACIMKRVFVYGPTGTGKTFTITSYDRAPGIAYLLMADLFTKMTELKETKIFELTASYVEVYNETVRDLLNPSSRPLQLREDSVNGVMVSNMKTAFIATRKYQ